MNTCQTCRHWEPPAPDSYSMPIHGTCRTSVSECGLSNPDEADPAVIVVETRSSFRAQFRTTAAFGCTLHKEKK